MSPLTYHRPKTLQEAIGLLGKGSPLGGGTQLAVQRRELEAVIDLQDLPLTLVGLEAGHVVAGAGTRLQQLLESDVELPEALRQALLLEAPLNLRNAGTLAGALLSADGRSPLATVMLALEAVVVLEPGGQELPLDQVLDRREGGLAGQLLTQVRFPLPRGLAYQQVSRSPKDLPIVCASMCAGGEGGAVRLALGGFGSRPLRVLAAEQALARHDLPAAVAAASALCATADDVWASGTYRSHVAGVLTRRLAQEVIGR